MRICPEFSVFFKGYLCKNRQFRHFLNRKGNKIAFMWFIIVIFAHRKAGLRKYEPKTENHKWQ